MSPTLLELIVALFLLWVAWRIGLWLTPRLFASLASFWRNSRSSRDPERWPPEKNITPPDAIPGRKSRPASHDHPR